jgi:hypothetical protein
MANEGTLRLSLSIRGGNVDERTSPTVCRFDVENPRPPSPGLVVAPTTGADVDLSALDVPGPCWMHNTSEDYPVEYGIHDGTKFHPLGYVLPGMICFHYFSPNFGQEPNVPTGTASGTDTVVNTFRVRGIGGSADIDVKCYDAG